MKGKMSFLMKGIYLILVIITIAIVSFLIINYHRELTSETEKLDLRTHALRIIDILSGSERCLGFQDEAGIEGKTLKLSHNKIIDLDKLENFSQTFSEYEPDCARDFEYRYNIRVKTLPIDLETKEWEIEEIIECREVCYQPKPDYPPICYDVCEVVGVDKSKAINVNIPSESWTFGNGVFSQDKALTGMVRISTPVIVRYNKSESMPAILWIDIADGELERFANAIDKSCLTGEEVISDLHFNYPVYKKVIDEKNYVCMEIRETTCQRLACKKEIELKEIKTPGNYKIIIKPEEIIKVII
ncbi:MAG: hypothetical protein QMD36_01465 [Candidatus Aenigmarchaeota archaeon]|nr:hypothetical protein [Candidatus Aenigmarchaeota archaeon]